MADDDAIPDMQDTNTESQKVTSGLEAGVTDYFKSEQDSSVNRTAEVLKHVGKGGVKQRASLFMKSPSAHDSEQDNNTPKRRPSAASAAFAMKMATSAVGGDKCVSCTKTVYPAERISCTLGAFHKNCFRCGLTTDRGCKSGLNVTNHDVYGGVLFCKTCSKKEFHADKQNKAFNGDMSPATPEGRERRASWNQPNKRASVSIDASSSSPSQGAGTAEKNVSSMASIFSSVSVDGNGNGNEKTWKDSNGEIVQQQKSAASSIFGAAEDAAAEEVTEESNAVDTAAVSEEVTEESIAVETVTETVETVTAESNETPGSFDKDDENDDGEESDSDNDEGVDAFESNDNENDTDGNKAPGSPSRDRRPSFNPLPGQKSLHECPFTYPFDKNGAIHWVGTMGGQMPYENPQKSGSLYLEISTLYRGQLLNLTSYANAETAQDRIAMATYTNNTARSWLVVDFGPERSLRPSYYCLKHGASGIGNSVRNWILEGKVDENSPWVELRKHVNDTTMREEPQSVAGYELVGDVCRNNFYRIFRITQYGKNSGALGLDKKHISKSHQKTYKFNLESAKTKSKRFDKLQVKRNLKRSVKEVDKLMKDMTDADNEAAEERRRDRNRLGLE